GWLAASEQVISHCLNLKHYTTICNNFLGEHYAIQILENEGLFLQKTADLLQENREIALNRLEKLKEAGLLDYINPDAGLSVFVKLPVDNTEPFCEAFEAVESILLLPGNKYGQTYRQFFRLGFGIETEKL